MKSHTINLAGIKERTVTIQISESAGQFIEQFIRASEVFADNNTPQNLEEARSYAVEALMFLLHNNPDVWTYAERMKKFGSAERSKK